MVSRILWAPLTSAIFLTHTYSIFSLKYWIFFYNLFKYYISYDFEVFWTNILSWSKFVPSLMAGFEDATSTLEKLVFGLARIASCPSRGVVVPDRPRGGLTDNEWQYGPPWCNTPRCLAPDLLCVAGCVVQRLGCVRFELEWLYTVFCWSFTMQVGLGSSCPWTQNILHPLVYQTW
jgi:hypothetical protein